MVPSIRDGGQHEANCDRVRVTGWVVALTTLTIMAVALVTEPGLVGFVLPALLVGILVAVILR